MDVCQLDLGAVEKAIQRLFLGFDALGCAAHDVLGDASFEVQLKELGLLILKGLEAAAVARSGPLDDADVLLGDCLDRVPYLANPLTRESERPIKGGDRVLDPIDRIVARRACAGIPSPATHAAEVFVHAAFPSMPAIDQARSAFVARQAALEIVMMPSGAIPGCSLRIESSLDAVEDGVVDQLEVSPLGLLAHVYDDPDVVGVAQQRVYAGPRQRPRSLLAGGATGQTVRFKSVPQSRDAVLAGVVKVEGELHQVSTILIEDDRVDEAPFEFDGCVLIADGRGKRRASGLVLLDLALADLIREVLVLILSESRVDAVVELPGGSVVNVLLHRRELSAGLVEPVVDDGIVHRLACEAIELVDDDVVDVAVALDVGDHSHEPRAILSLGGLRKIDVLSDNGRPELRGLARASLALGGHRVALIPYPRSTC